LQQGNATINHNEAFIELRELGLKQIQVAKGTNEHPSVISQAFRGKRPEVLAKAVRYMAGIRRKREARKAERIAS